MLYCTVSDKKNSSCRLVALIDRKSSAIRCAAAFYHLLTFVLDGHDHEQTIEIQPYYETHKKQTKKQKKSGMRLIFLPERLKVECHFNENRKQFRLVLDEQGQAIGQNNQVIFPTTPHEWTILSDDQTEQAISVANRFLNNQDAYEEGIHHAMIAPQAHPFIPTQDQLDENQSFLNEVFEDAQEAQETQDVQPTQDLYETHHALDFQEQNEIDESPIYLLARDYVAHQEQMKLRDQQEQEEILRRNEETENQLFREYFNHMEEEDLAPTAQDTTLPDLEDERNRFLCDIGDIQQNVNLALITDDNLGLDLDLDKVLEEHATISLSQNNSNEIEQDTSAKHCFANKCSSGNHVVDDLGSEGSEQDISANQCPTNELGQFKDLGANRSSDEGSRDEIFKIVSQNGLELKNYADWKHDFDIVCAAVRNNGLALEYAGISLRYNEEVKGLAVKQNVRAIEYTNELYE